ncbi:UNVERIFIED_CONTAM: hypothetical protein Slati_1420700 [Sesamum latifolium]|uniref:Uncharacterized protein n=1 Tax=Sesamum latifolium TaxID=2727402 RepID=A0AAW2X4H2_9LAMI
MQLGDIPLEKVNTSLYGFAGEVVHPQGMISLPLTLGAGAARRTCMLKFLVVDVSSAYNVILRRPTLNAFQVVIFTYHMKIKFPTPGGVGEVQGDPFNLVSATLRLCEKDRREPLTKSRRVLPLVNEGKTWSWKKSLKGQGHPLKYNRLKNC